DPPVRARRNSFDGLFWKAMVRPQECADVVDFLVREIGESVACNPAHFTEIASAYGFSGSHQMPEFIAPVHGDDCQRRAAVVGVVPEFIAAEIDSMTLGAGNRCEITSPFECGCAWKLSPAR